VVASCEGGVFALDADSGMRVWQNEGATGITDLVLWTWPAAPPSPATTEKAIATSPPGTGDASAARAAGKPAMHRVLIGSSGLSGLWGIDPEDGRELWRRDLPSGGLTAAEPVAGAALVGTTRYGMFLIAPLSGGIIDGMHGGGAFAATPAAHGTRAFVLSNEGVLIGLHVEPPRPGARAAALGGLDVLWGG
jgi:outer membrane protein assembly factor BamB